jgi:DNA-binding transcriptional regulator YdaS (Cro superfamily)
MNLKTYISGKRGRATALARAIKAYQSDVSAWADGKRPVPIPFGRPIEDATEGLVTRLDMFSEDVVSKVWPELLGGISQAAASDDVQPPVGTVKRSKRKK